VNRSRSSKARARDKEKKEGISRREFAARATVAAAAVAANAGALMGAAAVLPAAGARALAEPAPQTSGDKPKLPPAAQAEVDAKVAEILRRYGAKLSEEQKADVRRMVREAQEPLETLRAFPLENSDEPATVLHLAGTPARRAATDAAKPAAAPAKKPSGGA